MTTPASVLDTAVASLDPVDLDGLTTLADLQTRSTRKYVVTPEMAAEMISSLKPTSLGLSIDESRVFAYETLYFDTPDRALYLDTAHRRPHRFKVRIRHYPDAEHPMLELKTKNGRGATVKFRRPYQTDRPDELDRGARDWVDSLVDTEETDRLAPALITRFGRATVVASAGDARYTFDEKVRCLDPSGGREADVTGVVVECKSVTNAAAGDRWLWRQGVRPVALSKYCTGMAALHPELPANHWHRVLRRHVGC